MPLFHGLLSFSIEFQLMSFIIKLFNFYAKILFEFLIFTTFIIHNKFNYYKEEYFEVDIHMGSVDLAF